MISRSPRGTSVIFLFAIAGRSSFTLPSRWIVIACGPWGLLTAMTRAGPPLGPWGLFACATTMGPVMQQRLSGAFTRPRGPGKGAGYGRLEASGERSPEDARSGINVFLTLGFRQQFAAR